jgi:hypothetical protein
MSFDALYRDALSAPAKERGQGDTDAQPAPLLTTASSRSRGKARSKGVTAPPSIPTTNPLRFGRNRSTIRPCK